MKKNIYALLLVFVCCFGLLVPTKANAQAFADVPASHWAYSSVERAYSDNAVSGSDYNEITGVRKYSPESKLTVAEFVTIVTRAFYADDLAASSATGQWYATAQDVANTHSLTSGINSPDYNQTINRYQMAVIIYNIMVDLDKDLPTDNELAEFQGYIGDFSQIPSQYREAVSTVFTMGLITGKDNKGTFAGNDGVTRAEAAAIYCRLADVFSGVSLTPQKPSTSQSTSDNITITTGNGNVLFEDEQEEEVQVTVRIDPPAKSDDEFVQRMLNLINEARAANGVEPLVANEQLMQVAQVRSLEFAQNKSHTRPDGRHWITAYEDAGITEFNTSGENLICYMEPEEVVEACLNSPTHRANLLNPEFKEIGISYIIDYTYKRVFWAQNFMG